MNNDKKTNPYMLMAVEEAREGIIKGHGGPFGSVIVKGETIVSKGHNLVLKNNDSTAHGEIVAIRKADYIRPENHARCALPPVSGRT